MSEWAGETPNPRIFFWGVHIKTAIIFLGCPLKKERGLGCPQNQILFSLYDLKIKVDLSL